MSVLDQLFGGMREAVVPTASQQQSAATQTTQETKEPEPTGLDRHKELTTPIDPKSLPEKFDPSKLFDLDPSKLNQEIGKLDFTQAVSQEDLANIAAGGEAAIGAFRNALNAVSRSIFSNSFSASASLVQNGVAKSMPAVESRISEHFRRGEIDAALKGTDEIFDNPVAQIMLEPLKERLIAKHPTASPKEIANLAKEILSDFANKATEKERLANAPATPKKTDWDEWVKQPG